MFLDINFQTPAWCVEYMISLIPKNVTTILEPTPGLGNIVKKLEKQYTVTAPLDFWKIDGKFDAIVMNPPFSPMKTGYEILYKCMEMSDQIIVLLPWLSIINSNKRTKDVLDFGLRSITHLPRNTFPGARVQCCILEMSKGFDEDTIFKAIDGKTHSLLRND